LTIKKILVPFDDSGYSNRAFKKSLEIARQQKAEIIVATIMAGKYHFSMGPSIQLNQKSKNKEKTFADKVLSKLKNAAKKNDVKFTSILIINSSVEKGILEYAKSHKIDLIVMGSHGRTFFRKLVLGSVAYGVVHHSLCPVLVVK